MAAGWDMDGHKIISLIAGNLISEKGTRYVRETLGLSQLDDVPRRMAAASIEPDQWKTSPAYAWSRNFHFAFSDEETNCAAYDETRDCPGGRCIVTALAHYTIKAFDVNISPQERAEALTFLLHFMGDIHQPLHMGFVSDFGATQLWLSSPQMNLHRLWDFFLLNYHMERTHPGNWNHHTVFQQLIGDVESFLSGTKKVNRFFNFNDVQSYDSVLARMEWIAADTSSRLTCNVAYRHVDGTRIQSGDVLETKYLESRSSIVMSQFQKAGYRLAHLIDAVADRYYGVKAYHKKMTSPPKKVMPSPIVAAYDPVDDTSFSCLEIDDSDPETNQEDPLDNSYGDLKVAELSDDEKKKIANKKIKIPKKTGSGGFVPSSKGKKHKNSCR